MQDDGEDGRRPDGALAPACPADIIEPVAPRQAEFVPREPAQRRAGSCRGRFRATSARNSIFERPAAAGLRRNSSSVPSAISRPRR